MVTLVEAVELLNLGGKFDSTVDVDLSTNNSDIGGALNCATMLFKLQQHANGIGQGNILLLPMDLVEDIDRLWHHPIIQHVYQRRNEYQLNDSAA
jgi:guanine nucleotide-binding protein subunit alpha